MRTVLLLLAVVCLLALPAHALATPVLAQVKAGDADINATLENFQAGIGYYDGNVNGHFDTVPDEPAYIDVDNSHSVSYGDLRLTAFAGHASGVSVLLADIDMGRPLAMPNNAWFLRTTDGSWAIDMDASSTLTAGDIVFPAGTPAKADAATPGLGGRLARVEGSQVGMLSSLHREHDADTVLYAEMDSFTTGAGRVSAGDLRLTPAAAAAGAATTTGTAASGAMGGSDGAAAPAAATSAPPAWRTLDWLLVGVGVLNLVGLVAVARMVNHLRGPPRNPFK